jgi:hypothetical protein
MNSSSSITQRETRMVFRVLAGILAAFLLLCGLPMALHEVFTGSGEHRLWGILLAIGSVYSGVGLAVGARTGRWFKSACLERLRKYCSQFGARIFGFWRGFGEEAGLKTL